MITKRINIFIIAVIGGIVLGWGINIIQEKFESAIFASLILKSPPSFYLAEISQKYPSFYKINKPFPKITAESALAVEITKSGKQKIVYFKNYKKRLPIASLTKLMTAVISQESYKPDLFVHISKTAVAQPENIGQLKPGEILKVKDLLKIMLIESSNDAAYALSEIIGKKPFTDLMNLKAKQIGMIDTHFFNPTGLDQDETGDEGTNYSTAADLIKLGEYIIFNRPEILNIISLKKYPLITNGQIHHILHNTNILLDNKKVIGGKTGFTNSAGECLLIISQGKQKESYLISVVLNSSQRFKDMKKILRFYYDSSTSSNN